MKLISLNTWGGKTYLPLINFIKDNLDTDIFCLQEVYSTTSNTKQYKNIIRANLLEELIKILPNHRHFYSKELIGFDSNPDPVNFDLMVGKAIFVKKDFKAQNHQDLLLYGNLVEKNLKNDFSNLPVTLQSISIIINNKTYIIYNIHGTSFPGSKLDTPLRIKHSQKILELINKQPGSIIVTGDFNLLPSTKSIKILEQNLKNLIKEFNIQVTRSKLSPYAGRPDFQRFADYTFVSKDINVLEFKVPQIEISDHLPLILKCS